MMIVRVETHTQRPGEGQERIRKSSNVMRIPQDDMYDNA
jgi:hypothetical protein